MQESNFFATWMKVAGMMSRRLGLKLRFTRSMAATDFETIYIPAGDSNDRDYQVLATGYVIHEGGHVRFTTKEDVIDQSKEPLAAWLLNAIEDVRMEGCVIGEYPGAQHCLGNLVTQMVKEEKFFPSLDDQAQPLEAVQAAVLTGLRSQVLGQSALEPLATRADGLMRAHLGDELADRVMAKAMQVTTLVSSKGSVALARDIEQLLQDYIPPEPPEQQTPQASDGQEDDSQSDPQSGVDSQSNADPSQQGAGDGSDSSPSADDSDDSPSDPSDGGNDGESQQGQEDPSSSPGGDTTPSDSSVGGTHAPTDEELRKAIEDVLSGRETGIDGDISDHLEQALNDQANEASYDASQETLVMGGAMEGQGLYRWPRTDVNTSDMASEAASATSMLRVRLGNLLDAEREHRPRSVEDGLDVDVEEVFRFRAYRDLDIFADEGNVTQANTAVTIATDCSGSMGGSPMKLARSATYAIALALDNLDGVVSSIYTFPGSSQPTGIVKDFDEPVRSAAPGLASLHAHGGTPLTNCLPHALAALVDVEHVTRRIMIIITDGGPDNPQACASIIKRAQAHGVEVVGVGIGGMSQDALLSFCPEALSIEDMRQLAPVVIRLLTKRLLAAA